LLVRGRIDNSAPLRAAVAAAVNAVEPDAPFQFFGLRQMIGVLAWVFGAFSAAASLLGALGLLLAFSGTFAVVSFLVAQRTREFGVRLALGATVPRIVSGMLGETFRTASFGVAGGLAVAAGLARALSAVTDVVPVFGLRAYVIGTAIVLVSTMTAALLPSLRTARIDPSSALRAE
jgi:ABC-type antimicrobial peptide transport system permease subunit